MEEEVAMLGRCALASLTAIGLLVADVALTDTDPATLEAGKHVLVCRLDPTLPRTSFERWFRRVVGKNATISWEVNDCGEACGCPADSGRDLPVCVQASAPLRDETVAGIWIMVRTVRTGAGGKVALANAYFARGDSVTASFKTLSSFASAVRRARQPRAQ